MVRCYTSWITQVKQSTHKINNSNNKFSNIIHLGYKVPALEQQILIKL